MPKRQARHGQSPHAFRGLRHRRFEPWNEPDHACNMQRKLDVGIACDLPSWLAMYAASSRAITAVSPLLQFGGPNTGGSTLGSAYFDALLERVAASRRVGAAAAVAEIVLQRRRRRHDTAAEQWHHQRRLQAYSLPDGLQLQPVGVPADEARPSDD